MTNVSFVFEIIKENKESFLSKDTVSNIIAFFNFIAVLFIFWNEKKNRNDEKRIARKSFWFRNIVVDRNLEYAEDFFDKAINNFPKVNENLNDNNVREKIRIFQREKRKLISKLNDSIRIINKSLSVELDVLLDDFEDFYTERIQHISSIKDEIEIIIIEYEKDATVYRNRYFSYMYKFEMDGYEWKE